MDEKTEKILKSLNSKKVGIFCDDSNLYYSYKKCGWRVDFGKFKIFLGYKENLAWELRLCQHIYLNKLKKIVGLDIFKNKPQV